MGCVKVQPYSVWSKRLCQGLKIISLYELYFAAKARDKVNLIGFTSIKHYKVFPKAQHPAKPYRFSTEKPTPHHNKTFKKNTTSTNYFLLLLPLISSNSYKYRA